MRKAWTYILTAVVGGGMGVCTATLTQAADRRAEANPSENTAQNATPQLPDGFQMKELNKLDNVRKELARVTNIALTKDDFGKLVDSLALVNRERMKDYKNEDFKTLDGVIEQVRQDWKAKYGHDFDISKASDVFTDQFVIVQGVVTNPDVAASNWPVPASHDAQLAANRNRADIGQAVQVERDDLKDSGGVALVRFPESHAMPGITASVIDEKGHGWRFAAPVQMTAQELHTQLQNHLTALDQHKSSWPADENQAYRAAAHHVLMALYDVNMPQGERATR